MKVSGFRCLRLPCGEGKRGANRRPFSTTHVQAKRKPTPRLPPAASSCPLPPPDTGGGRRHVFHATRQWRMHRREAVGTRWGGRERLFAENARPRDTRTDTRFVALTLSHHTTSGRRPHPGCPGRHRCRPAHRGAAPHCGAGGRHDGGWCHRHSQRAGSGRPVLPARAARPRRRRPRPLGAPPQPGRHSGGSVVGRAGADRGGACAWQPLPKWRVCADAWGGAAGQRVMPRARESENERERKMSC